MDWTSLQTRLNSSTLAAFGSTDSAPITLNGAPVQAVFDNGYTLGTAGPLGMDTSAPSLRLATSLVPTAYQGLPATHLGVSYVVGAHQPDGMGMSVLLLERAPA